MNALEWAGGEQRQRIFCECLHGSVRPDGEGDGGEAREGACPGAEGGEGVKALQSKGG